MLAISVTHALARTTQQGDGTNEAVPNIVPEMVVYGGGSLVEQTMTCCYGLQRMIELQTSAVVKLGQVAEDINDMTVATENTRVAVEDGVAHVVCPCRLRRPCCVCMQSSY
jgi:hypothetical protein